MNLAGWSASSAPAASFIEPLVIHKPESRPQAATLVVFVHGLGGDRHKTWGQFPSFLEEDLPDAHAGSYAYRTLSSRLGFGTSIELDREAVVLADTLRDCAAYHRIILIGHSMGGLLCKAAISELLDRGDNTALRRLKGLFLLATPQAGSRWMLPFLPWLSRDMRALSPYGEFIERIHRTFIDRVSAGPGSPPEKLRLPVFAVTAAEDAWVSALSSGLNIPSANRKVVRGSHTSIVKPRSREDDVYRWVLARLNEIASDNPNLDPGHLQIPTIGGLYGPDAEQLKQWKRLEGQLVSERYSLISLVGSGGTGAVFRAREKSLGREVAVKLFYSVEASPENTAALNAATAKAVRGLAALHHPNLQKLIDYGVIATPRGASLMVVTEFIAGQTLERHLFGPRDEGGHANDLLPRLSLARQITQALIAAHSVSFIGQSGVEERGVCHGDLTPRNILITPAHQPVLIDFMIPDVQRLVAAQGDNRSLWQISEAGYSVNAPLTGIYGTPGYMPPEQALDGIVTTRSDVYTLGLTFAALFFATQHGETSSQAFLADWQHGWRPSPTTSSRIEEMISKMTKIQPEDRLQSMSQVDAWLIQIEL